MQDSHLKGPIQDNGRCSRKPGSLRLVLVHQGRPATNSCPIGLELARLADLPNDVIEEARRVANALADIHARREEESETTIMAVRRRAVSKVRCVPDIPASRPIIGRP